MSWQQRKYNVTDELHIDMYFNDVSLWIGEIKLSKKEKTRDAQYISSTPVSADMYVIDWHWPTGRQGHIH